MSHKAVPCNCSTTSEVGKIDYKFQYVKYTTLDHYKSISAKGHNH